MKLSITFHPQTDGQVENTIQTLEDSFRDCVIDFNGSWDKHFPFVEFSYKNSYHFTISMAPFEAFYGRRYRSPLGGLTLASFHFLVPN